MVLLSKPVSSGGVQDVYEVLETAYGGSDFDENEAVDLVADTLKISASQAKSLIGQLSSSGCAQ